MTAPTESTAVAVTEKKAITASDPRVQTKFLEAYSAANLDKLPKEKQAAFLLALGQHIGVRAELGELILYQGKPYITIDGRIHLSHESGLLNGMDVSPASSIDRQRYGAEEGDHLWKALVWRRGASRPFTGWGFVPKGGDRNPVSKSHPREMARKRAKYDALRLAFPPNETITPFHQQLIESAEQEAEKVRATLPAALTAGDYPEPEAEVLGAEMESDGVLDDTATDAETGEDFSNE